MSSFRTDPFPDPFPITGHIRAGENRVEVLVFNTLANHYRTIPTRYRGDLTSGLLGPVTLEIWPGGSHTLANAE